MNKVFFLLALVAVALAAPSASVEEAKSDSSDLETAEFFIKYWPWVYYKPVVAVQAVPYTYTYTIPKLVISPVPVVPVAKVVAVGAAVIPVSVNVEATVAKTATATDTSS